MKYYYKTLLEIDHKLNLSQVGTCASCWAAEAHGTKEYAKQDVARHRAISMDVRRSIDQLLRQLDWYDYEVEKAFETKVVCKRIPEELC